MINVNLVGNPNTGKTTLFNSLTSSHEHVGNWHGVTVEEKSKCYKFKNEEINIVDLPGIYSMTSLSYEEKVACDYILKHKDRLIVNICDASNLQRNLYLTLGLMELGCHIILAVNQIDKRPICKINFSELERLLNLRVVYINADNKKSVEKLNDAILEESKKFNNTYYNLPYIKKFNFNDINKIVPNDTITFYKIKILEDDEEIKKKFNIKKSFSQVDKVATERYRYIDEIIKNTCGEKQRIYGASKLDKILLNRYLALPIFICLIAISFYLTFFSLGAWLSDGLTFLLDKFVGQPLIDFLINVFGSDSWIIGLFQNAIIGGVGSILTFLPQVALLFFFLSLLEDSGYLSRVAFVFEDILGKVGLSGKSVYTLLMGFGCSTTAVLTARNMDDKNSKIKTGLLTPYMSCSAKFPIYAVLGGAFFGANNIWVIIGIYFLGVAVAILMSYIFEKTFLPSKKQSFILEFPPYRMMSFKRTFSLLWINVKLFVARVGTLIVAMNVIVWILSNFSFTFQYIVNTGGKSMLESLGKIFAPLFIPLGFNSWGLVSALIAGLVAKEVIVSSIAMFNGNGELSISALGQSLMDSSSAVYFVSDASVLSYLVFCLLYFPCLATTSVLIKEIGRKWTVIGVLLEFLVAYVVSMLVYFFALICQIYGVWKIILLVFATMIILFSIRIIYKRIKNKKGCGKCESCSTPCNKV